jgi:hypothetical protein
MKTKHRFKNWMIFIILAPLLLAASGPATGLLSMARTNSGEWVTAYTGAANATPVYQGQGIFAPAPWHDPICAGDKQRYTLSYVNLTSETLTNVWFEDTLGGVCPEWCDVCQWNDNLWPHDDCSVGAMYDGERTVRWFFPSVAPGQRIDLYLEVRLWTSVPAGVFTNCLTVTSDQLPDATACSQVTVLLCYPPVAAPTETPRPLPTRQPGEVCYDSVPGNQMVYRITRDDFYGYTTDNAGDSALVGVTSPPAPAGWTLPGFVPDNAWVRGRHVWWEEWLDPRWKTFEGAQIVGLNDAGGRAEGVDGITHLIRHTFQLDPPQPNMRITSAILEQWSDNKTAWWWQGELMVDELEGNDRQDQMYPLYIDDEGGTYSLAIQNSNDRQYAENPQGTAYRLCVIWVPLEGITPPATVPAAPTATATETPTTQHVLLPLIMMGQ